MRVSCVQFITEQIGPVTILQRPIPRIQQRPLRERQHLNTHTLDRQVSCSGWRLLHCHHRHRPDRPVSLDERQSRVFNGLTLPANLPRRARVLPLSYCSDTRTDSQFKAEEIYETIDSESASSVSFIRLSMTRSSVSPARLDSYALVRHC
jgi:hypothetical protein